MLIYGIANLGRQDLPQKSPNCTFWACRIPALRRKIASDFTEMKNKNLEKSQFYMRVLVTAVEWLTWERCLLILL